MTRLTSLVSERSRDAERKRQQRNQAKLVAIPKCADIRRRRRLEKDDVKWLMYYFAPASGSESAFTYEFTIQQREMIAAIREAIINGGDQAIAASRGEGKTILFERMLLKYTLTGIVKFSVLFAATGTAAQDSLESIKVEIESNDRLAADYPEVCIPVRALENTPNRAHYQLVSGHRHDDGKPYAEVSSKFSWCGQEIYMPCVPGSPASGGIIATRGLDSAVRGVKKKGRRVDVAGIDDPDTEETARSPEQAEKLEARIDRAIAGLGGQQRSVARIMLTTLQNRTCVSYRFTDPTQKPSWKGKRFRFLVTPPTRVDLWQEYVDIKHADWQEGTDHATEFYIANRDAMHEGAEVANPNRYTQGELSALQHYYNRVAKLGQEAVDTEYNNDPPEIASFVDSGITEDRIKRKLSGYPKHVVPPDCKVLTQGVDVGLNRLYWVVKAWRPDASFYVVDYEVVELHGQDIGVEFAIERGIQELFAKHRENPFCTVDGEIVDIGMTLIDSGWESKAVYAACGKAGLGVMPSKGHGGSNGCASVSFNEQLKRTIDRKPGFGCFQSRQPGNVWLVHCDADFWKAFDHARWMTPDGHPGSAYLFGSVTDEEKKYTRREPKAVKVHQSYAKHLTAEVETEDFVRGKTVRRWVPKRSTNHYFDASYLADAAAGMLGIRLMKSKEASAPPTLADLAKRARR